MLQLGEYDPTEDIGVPSSALIYQMLDPADMSDLNSAGTPAGMDPANLSHSNSPTNTFSPDDIFHLDGLDIFFEEVSGQPFVGGLGTTLPPGGMNSANLSHSNSPTDTSSPGDKSLLDEFATYLGGDNGAPLGDGLDITWAQTDSENIFPNSYQEDHKPAENTVNDEYLSEEGEQITIIAEPKAKYRERYSSELDPLRNRAQRFIRTEEDNKKYEYPTIRIPAQWCDPWRSIYIRVALVTTISELVPHHCIHPYTIDTPEKDVIKDPEQNCLYFRINNDESRTGEKSFHISRKKKVQTELRSHGPMRILDTDQSDIQRVRNPQDAKQLIATYQLWKSQLVFTVAERLDQQPIPRPIFSTTTTSKVMSDEASRAPNGGARQLECANLSKIKCIPSKSAWGGGDEVVLILANPIKHKVFDVAFDFGQFGELPAHNQTQVDTKTIVFRTPACPILPPEENIKVSLVIRSERSIVTRMDFHYLTPRSGSCQNCQQIKANYNMTNKRRSHLLYDCFTDGGDSLARSMNELSLRPTPPSTSRVYSLTSSNEKDLKFEKYLNQLKDAVAEFLRTDNPSRLFRRTRLLLSQCDPKSPPLHDAIQRGHVDLARALIEQVYDMPTADGLLEKQNEDGQTVLLMAAKFSRGNIVEMLLQKRSDLVQHVDKQKNNFLHLLAENGSTEMIEHSLALLSDQVRQELLSGKNRANQRPIDIAQSHGNSQCVDLLKCPVDLK